MVTVNLYFSKGGLKVMKEGKVKQFLEKHKHAVKVSAAGIVGGIVGGCAYALYCKGYKEGVDSGVGIAVCANYTDTDKFNVFTEKVVDLMHEKEISDDVVIKVGNNFYNSPNNAKYL